MILNNTTPSFIVALGEYEKQVILELDKLSVYRGARLYKDRYGARILFCLISNSWERKHSVQDCLLSIHKTSLLLFRGYVPTLDAIANPIEIKPLKQRLSER